VPNNKLGGKTMLALTGNLCVDSYLCGVPVLVMLKIF
jgi:hypothetical protein